MPQDKQAYHRADDAYSRDLVAGKPSPTALERLGRQAQKKGPPATCTEAQIATLYQRWTTERPRVSLAVLAQDIGLSRQRLHQLFKRQQGEGGKCWGPGRTRTWSDRRVAELYDRWRRGITLRALGHELGVTGVTIHKLIRRYLREHPA